MRERREEGICMGEPLWKVWGTFVKV